MIEAAQQKLGESTGAWPFVTVDSNQLPFLAEGAFDALIANYMLYHVPDRQQALSW